MNTANEVAQLSPPLQLALFCVLILLGYLVWWFLIAPLIDDLRDAQQLSLADGDELDELDDAQTVSVIAQRPVQPPDVALAHYVTTSDSAAVAHVTPDQAFERPELPAFVQRSNVIEQLEAVANVDIIDLDDLIRLDTIARLLAAGVVAESTAIVATYDGVAGVRLLKKGGGDAYVAHRDVVRVLAASYGWKPKQSDDEQPVTAAGSREIPIAGGKQGSFSAAPSELKK